MRVARRWPQDRERRSGELFSQKRRDRRGHTRDPAFATPRPDETEGSSQDRAIKLRALVLAIVGLLSLLAGMQAEAPELQQLRIQLKTAQDADDKPAIIELSQRIVAISSNDSNTWEMLAQTQLDNEDLDGLERTLDAWQKSFRRPPAAIDDFRASLCFERKDY